MSDASTQHKRHQKHLMHGHYGRVRRGYESIDGRTYAGREAKAWRRWAIAQKGNGSCPYHIRQEITLCAFDLWLLIELAGEIADDAKKRGRVLNQRRKKLPDIHTQYNTIAIRFSSRCEALKLEAGPLDLARRLMMERAQADANGGAK